jgi:hypothetical protein
VIHWQELAETAGYPDPGTWLRAWRPRYTLFGLAERIGVAESTLVTKLRELCIRQNRDLRAEIEALGRDALATMTVQEMADAIGARPHALYRHLREMGADYVRVGPWGSRRLAVDLAVDRGSPVL